MLSTHSLFTYNTAETVRETQHDTGSPQLTPEITAKKRAVWYHHQARAICCQQADTDQDLEVVGSLGHVEKKFTSINE